MDLAKLADLFEEDQFRQLHEIWNMEKVRLTTTRKYVGMAGLRNMRTCLLRRFLLRTASARYMESVVNAPIIKLGAKLEDFREPNLPREEKKIDQQVHRLQAVKAGRRAVEEVLLDLPHAKTIVDFLDLQFIIDKPVRKYGLDLSASEVNSQINSRMREVWEALPDRVGKCPHIRKGHSYSRAENGWREAHIVNFASLRPAQRVRTQHLVAMAA